MTVELRTRYHDPRDPVGDRNGGYGSTRTSVVRPIANPQQAVVTEVNVPEFYNQANDMQPSRVDPRWGLLHTEPAVLRPDPMWAFRWPDAGPYRGMTAEPFAWEERQQMNGFGAITEAQRTEYGRLQDLAETIRQALVRLRRGAVTPAQVGEVALIEGQFENAQRTLEEAGQMDDQELSMAMTEVDIELRQVDDRVAAYEMALGSEGDPGFAKSTTVAVGAALVVGLGLFWLMRRDDGL